jgi:hypothetical protein
MSADTSSTRNPILLTTYRIAALTKVIILQMKLEILTDPEGRSIYNGITSNV